VDNAYRAADCAAEHQAEVIYSNLPPADLSDEYPLSNAAVSPTCRAVMRDYLGSSDVEASRIEHRVLWPEKDQWTRGDRWFACALLERDPENRAAKRSGSLAGALHNGLGSLRKCYAQEPLDEPTQVVPCHQPHRSEAVAGVIPLGSHTDPAPSLQTMIDRSLDRCVQPVSAYLKDAQHPNAAPRSILPDPQYWASGATVAVCYAVSTVPVTGTMGSDR
jgi:hypothetical protein